MNHMIEGLYTAMEQDGYFEELEREISNECNERMGRFRERLQPQDFEALRDIVFSIHAISKKASFEAGFKAATRLFMECAMDEPPT